MPNRLPECDHCDTPIRCQKAGGCWRERKALGPSDATDCSAPLKWKQSGPEWQAEVHPEFQYVAMEIEGAWHAFLFLGSKYKRGHTIATDFETADEAKQKCQDHYESLLPQNAEVWDGDPKTPPRQ